MIQEGEEGVDENDELSELCLFDVPTPRCPPLNCTSILAGWVLTSCTRWALDTVEHGYCSAAGRCLTEADCAQLPGQHRVAVTRLFSDSTGQLIDTEIVIERRNNSLKLVTVISNR